MLRVYEQGQKNLSATRMWTAFLLVLPFIAAVAVHAPAQTISSTAASKALPSEPGTALREGWRLESACKLQADGAVISTDSYHPTDWLATSVPATVLAAQVAAGVVPQPYYGTNLRNLPGETYPVGMNFSNLPMPADSPYRCGWWYRKEFTVDSADKGKTLWLHFGGINYRADIWLNGKKIADKSEVAGAYRTYDFNVTNNVFPGKPNTLAIETFAPSEKDLGINWVDWNPCPPDKDMGLWGGVTLMTTGPVSLRSPLAVTHFADSTLREAQLTVYAELQNNTDKPLRGIATGVIAERTVEQAVDLAAHEQKTVVFSPDKFSELRIRNPKIWWPNQMGDPHLEKMTLRFSADGRVSDEKSVEFGIREMTSEMTDKGYRLFKVNGKPLLIRGAGWSQDMLLRHDPARLRDEIRLVRDMHLNTIRLEGKLETDDFFQLADQQGILVMLGWCCCDQWEHWKHWTPENYTVAAESLRSQMYRIRHHASLLVWLNGSDGPPPADVESAYLRIEAETHWPNPTLSSASGESTSVSGQSGVKMTGPYDYVAPSYWYFDSKFGGAYGFNTETSPGPAIPNLASLHKFIPADQTWPPNATWSLHNGGGEFRNIDVFNEAMNATYTPASSAEDYIRLSQTLSYDSERAMFEAYGRNKYTSTGVIQWMLNNAWPSMIWHLYDYYLDADGGYFGTKKACEPLHIQYSYDDHSVVVVNSTYQPAIQLTAITKVYDFNLKPLFSLEKTMDANADSSNRALTIPASTFETGSQIYFVDLTLKNAAGESVSRNFYWLPAKLTVFNWAKTDYTHTPVQQYESMKALRSLPTAELESSLQMSSRVINAVEERVIEVHLHNPSHALAFQVSGAARGESGELIAPVLWSDNYVELLPGESRTLTAILPKNAPKATEIILSGWNIRSVTLHSKEVGQQVAAAE